MQGKKTVREPWPNHVATNYYCHYYYITNTFKQPCAFQSVTFRVHIVPGTYYVLINQREALISQIYFWNRTLYVSDSTSVHHQESSNVHTPISIGHTGDADCLLAGS